MLKASGESMCPTTGQSVQGNCTATDCLVNEPWQEFTEVLGLY